MDSPSSFCIGIGRIDKHSFFNTAIDQQYICFAWPEMASFIYYIDFWLAYSFNNTPSHWVQLLQSLQNRLRWKNGKSDKPEENKTKNNTTGIWMNKCYFVMLYSLISNGFLYVKGLSNRNTAIYDKRIFLKYLFDIFSSWLKIESKFRKKDLYTNHVVVLRFEEFFYLNNKTDEFPDRPILTYFKA